ncbi:MAG: polysaccharide pyruvyl transferase family protein [Clostridia bacterium]|nr:polysaccharide pyruvyl transferase family protein [Clostridia bacterium]
MKKVAIVTIYDLNNCGNRLQNYALQYFIENKGLSVMTIKNNIDLNHAADGESRIKNTYKFFKQVIKDHTDIITKNQRLINFVKFNKNIKTTPKYYSRNNKVRNNEYDYYIVGSDQVWNPTIHRMTNFELLNFIDSKNKIAYAASLGVNNIDEESSNKLKSELQKFKAISVREDAGKKIIDGLRINKTVEVLIDPTMLLSDDEWDKVSNKPKNIKENERYILNYFLGKLPEEWDNEIRRIAKENDCKIINLLDESDPYYVSGPSEFLYLEKNAFLVCTDSFHSSVFSIIYDTPFVVFKRKDKLVSMNSRLDTLLSKFELENRKFNGRISDDLLKCDYSNAKEILLKEQNKSAAFLKNALREE